MHGVLLVPIPGFLQARGTVAPVACTLVGALPVAVVYVDIQVMALCLRDVAGCAIASATLARRARRCWADRPVSRVAYLVVKERGSRHAWAR
jgi:hypothetical protein